MAEFLQSLNLDFDYVQGEGSCLITSDGKHVTDFVGGFGATVLGHNNREITKVAIEALENKVAINAQASLRNISGRLAKRLSDLTPGDQEYFVNFSNSGAESIEAAIKHAYKVHLEKVNEEYERLTRILNDFYYSCESRESDIKIPGDKSLIDFRDDLDEYNLTQFEEFQNHPVLVSLKGAFHGKTSSAIKITFNKSFRESFEGLSAINSVFVDAEDIGRMKEILEEHTIRLFYPLLINDIIELRTVSITKVFGLSIEIVQGEGGIKPLSDETLEELVTIHKELKVPFILDEIQTGCGRLGRVFGYENTPLASISPEYITLSKALGGGIAKIGATLIRKDIYDHDFGILHTSTFGEDDFSSTIALSFIDLITKDANAFCNDVNRKGAYIQAGLEDLKKKYPSILKEVRGKGLMIGLEFNTLDEYTPFFRATGKQGVLSLLIASYLLHYYNIRILSPLTTILKGNPGRVRLSIIRIQPPVTIKNKDIDLLVSALDEVLNIIKCNNEYCLVSHLLGVTLTEEDRRNPVAYKVKYPVIEEKHAIDARTGFVVHPTRLEYLVEYYFPSFKQKDWDRSKLFEWWNSVCRFLEPVHAKCNYIVSNKFSIENSLVFIPYLPEYLTTIKEKHKKKEVRDKIKDAIIVAKELGDDNIPVSIVGLGAYTSILSLNGQLTNDYEMAITTGNAYTTGLTIQGILKAASVKGIDIGKSKIAIVGASGNIGSVVSQILSLNAGSLLLMGRPGEKSFLRLNLIRERCLLEMLKNIRELQYSGDDIYQNGFGELVVVLFESLSKDNNIELLQGNKIEDNTLKKITRSILKSPDYKDVQDRIAMSIDMEDMKGIDIVAVATNSPDPELIKPRHMKEGSIICCTSVPSNLSEEFEGNKSYLAFDGGLSRLPDESSVDFVGMPGGNIAYGCLAETLILGFEGQNHSYAKGELNTEQVYHIMELADQHGFELGHLKLHENIISDIKNASSN